MNVTINEALARVNEALLEWLVADRDAALQLGGIETDGLTTNQPVTEMTKRHVAGLKALREKVALLRKENEVLLEQRDEARREVERLQNEVTVLCKYTAEAYAAVASSPAPTSAPIATALSADEFRDLCDVLAVQGTSGRGCVTNARELVDLNTKLRADLKSLENRLATEKEQNAVSYTRLGRLEWALRIMRDHADDVLKG